MRVRELLMDPAEGCGPVARFFTALALCHTVIPNTGGGRSSDSKEGPRQEYQGPSPDEVALVAGAAGVGMRFIRRTVDRDKAIVFVLERDVRGSDQSTERRQFKILHVLEFNSDRKRMSVICEDESDGEIYLYSKGADMVMLPRFQPKPCERTMSQITRFSKEGLRTLMVGYKRIPREEYATWVAEHDRAAVALDDREELLDASADAIEADLTFLGISAVEDQLQEQVPETLALLKRAGIRIWVLTGDKVETAVDISYSAGLFQEHTHLFTVSAATAQTIVPLLEEVLRCCTEESGLVLDGPSLYLALEDPEAKKLLLEAALRVSACCCCRLAPKQKSAMVLAVREALPDMITLGIGDGANDVPMIHSANIGVGIRGKEGTQAVMASDYAISRFWFLQRLLFVHGRMGYRRVSTMICYYFYKNIALGFSDVVWAFFNGASVQSMYPDWLTQAYNAVFTSFTLQRENGTCVCIPPFYGIHAYMHT